MLVPSHSTPPGSATGFPFPYHIPSSSHHLPTTSLHLPSTFPHPGALSKLVSALLLATTLVQLCWWGQRTWARNWDWLNEERLFISALDVCPDSAKVQLNNGILQRRRGDLRAALGHFERARQLEPGYCEPGYWVGVTQLNLGGWAWGCVVGQGGRAWLGVFGWGGRGRVLCRCQRNCADVKGDVEM